MEFRPESELTDSWSGCTDFMIQRAIVIGDYSRLRGSHCVQERSRAIQTIVSLATSAKEIAAYRKEVGSNLLQAAGRECRLARLSPHSQDASFTSSSFSRTKPTYA